MNRRTLLVGLGAALAAACAPKKSSPTAQDTIRAVFINPDEPALSAEHGKLISSLRVFYMPVEEGAPGIDPQFPFGDKVDVVQRALLLLGITDRLKATRLLAEAGRILPEYIRRAQLAPGKYTVPADMAAYFKAFDSGVASDGSFMFQEAHATLLRGANWEVVGEQNIETVLGMSGMWPMPNIDGKRPYGDMSYYQLDMARLLGEPYAIGADQSALPDEAKDARLAKLHDEMTAALQVFLSHARAAP